MPNGPLWSVKGIDDETREIARRAAEASGQTIGLWIDGAIRKRTSPPEVSTIKLVAPPPAPAAAAIAPPVVLGPSATGKAAEKFVRLAVTPVPLSPSEPLAPRASEGLRPPGSLGRAAGSMDLARIATNRTILTAGLAFIVAVAVAWIGTLHFGSQESDASERIARSDVPAKAADPVATGGPTASLAATPMTQAPATDRLRVEAERGDAIAQNDLGLLYATGRDVARDEREAVKWFERAAAQGAVNAQFNLGVMYQRGGGIAADLRQAVSWYRSAAERGHPLAQHNLATLYSRGEGADQDHAAAAQWFARAAEAGIAASQFRLAQAYESGLGVDKDPAAARAWYARAAAQGHERAQEMERRIKDEPAMALAPASVTVSRDTIHETQRLLARLSYQPGAVDGNLGPQTQRAIRDFQRDAGLPMTGITSPDLVEALRERDTIRETQRLLSRLSFQTGAVDGRLGPQTERAIRDFQRAAGLAVTGVASPELLEELKVVAGAMRR